MTDTPTTALTLLDIAPSPTALTTGASPVTVAVGPRLYEITTGGTAGSESIVIPLPDLPVDTWVNDRLVGLRISFCQLTQTDPADKVVISVAGASNIALAAPNGFVPARVTNVSLSYVGATVSFVWANDVWMIDSDYSDGDFDYFPQAGVPHTFGGGSDEAGTGLSATITGGGAKSASNGNGGDVILSPGGHDGSGRQGLVIISGVLPAADPMVAGALWLDTGVLAVSTG